MSAAFPLFGQLLAGQTAAAGQAGALLWRFPSVLPFERERKF